MGAEELRRAYAVLGLTPGVAPRALKRRYRELVRTWHPDRFASDPIGQAQAEQRLREINLAYDAIGAAPLGAPAHVDAPPSTAPVDARAVRPLGARLSREEIDAMVAAIGTRSLLEETFDSLGRWGHTLRFGLFGAVLVVLVAAALREGGAGLPLVALVAGVVAWREWRQRQRAERTRPDAARPR